MGDQYVMPNYYYWHYKKTTTQTLNVAVHNVNNKVNQVSGVWINLTNQSSC